MAKSHPELSYQYTFVSNAIRMALRTRNAVSAMFSLGCLLTLLFVLHNQYGIRLAASVMDAVGAIDLVRLLPQRLEAQDEVLAADPVDRKYRVIGEYLARRYSVSSDATTDIVAESFRIAAQLKLDPMLILAVISVESRFNPIAESSMGAKGLMQIIPRFHSDKFKRLGGEKVAFEPGANIWVGASILKDYIRRTRDVVDALQLYVGASSVENENGYSAKVMSERDRLNQVLLQHQLETRQVRLTTPPRKQAV